MAEYKEAYKFCRYLRSKQYNDYLEKNPPRNADEAAVKLLELYKKYRKRQKVSDDQAMETIQFCFKQGYVEWLGKDQDIAVITIPKGAHLLGKSFFFFRVGLWDESWKAYEAAKSVIVSGAVATIVAAVISGIVTWLTRH